MKSARLNGVIFYLLIVFVGIVSGLGAILFRDLIGFFHNIFFYAYFSSEYDVLKHAMPSRWGMGIIFVPVAGAVIVAFLVKQFAPEARGHGVPEVMDAIYYERGVVRPVVALVKAVASSICIGSGGSVGREGPIIQIGAAFGSTLGQWIRVADWQRITLIACGSAGGIAATFNAPLGGMLFAVEIMLPELSARTLIPVGLATAIATYVSYVDLGNVPLIPMAILPVTHHWQAIVAFGVLSIVAGVLSAIFIRSVYFAEDTFDGIKNVYLRHMLGMLFVGISMYFMVRYANYYYIQGVGYATILDVLNLVLVNPFFLFFLAMLKLCDTSITLGSGGSGGVFSPLLFIGATFGAGFAALMHYIFPGQIEMSLQLGALAGMAAMVGASTGAMMTAIVMTAELVKLDSIILPLIIVVVIANLVRRQMVLDTVYTLKLTRRGHHIPSSLHSSRNVMT